MKFAALAFAAIGVIAIGSLLFVVLIPGFLCDNRLIEEVLSPDGKMKAVVFRRECSSSGDYATQVSIVPAGTGLPSGVGNIFIANTNDGAAPLSNTGAPAVEVHWRDQTFLVLSHHPNARVFLSKSLIGDIRVGYHQTGPGGNGGSFDNNESRTCFLPSVYTNPSATAK